MILAAILLLLGIMWAASIIGYVISLPFVKYLGPNSIILGHIGIFAVFCVVAIPIASGMLLITRWFSRYRIPQKWKSSMRLTWVVSLVVASFLFFNRIMAYNHMTQTVTSETLSGDYESLNLTTSIDPENNIYNTIVLPHLKLTNNGLLCDNIQYQIYPSKTNQFEIDKVVSAFGANIQQSEKNSTLINSNFTVKDNNLFIPTDFRIHKSGVYRGQGIIYKIYIPIGKQISFDKRIANRINNRPFDNESAHPKNFENYTWSMTKDGLLSSEWDKEYRTERIIDVTTLQNINIEGYLRTKIVYAKTPSIKLTGPKSEIDRIENVTTSDATSLIVNGRISDKVKLEISTPELLTIQARQLNTLRIEGFKQKEMEITYQDNGEVSVYIDVDNLTCNIDGRSTFNFIGSSNNFIINGKNYPRVNAEKFKSKHTKINGILRSRSTIHASEILKYSNGNTHQIKVYGNPSINQEEEAPASDIPVTNNVEIKTDSDSQKLKSEIENQNNEKVNNTLKTNETK